jgi:hypothetical protein
MRRERQIQDYNRIIHQIETDIETQQRWQELQRQPCAHQTDTAV